MSIMKQDINDLRYIADTLEMTDLPFAASVLFLRGLADKLEKFTAPLPQQHVNMESRIREHYATPSAPRCGVCDHPLAIHTSIKCNADGCLCEPLEASREEAQEYFDLMPILKMWGSPPGWKSTEDIIKPLIPEMKERAKRRVCHCGMSTYPHRCMSTRRDRD